MLKMLDDVVNFVGNENFVEYIKKGRRISTYIYGKIMLISIMKKFTNGRDLIKPSMHRFSMTYLTLSCLHELKASLMNMFSSEEWKTSKFGTSQEGRKVQNGALEERNHVPQSCCPFYDGPSIGGFRCKTHHGFHI